MPNTPVSPPLRWLFGSREQRQAATRYWVRDTTVGLTELALYRLLRLGPTNFASWVGAVIVNVTRYHYPASEKRARLALVRLRPTEADPASVDAAINRLWRCVSRTMMEYSVLDRLWAEGRVTVTGVEHVERARAEGRPILAAAVHLGNWEVVALAGKALGYHGSGLYLPPENRFEHRIVVDARSRFGADLVPASPQSLRAALRELKTGRGIFVVFIDDLINDRVNIPTFGRPLPSTGNVVYVARIAAMTGAAVLPVYCVRLRDSANFQVTILPAVPLVYSETGDAVLRSNIALIDAAITPAVRDHLDQWFYSLDIEFPE